VRGLVGRLLLVLGVFAVVAGGVAIFWGKDAAYRIPMNTDSFTRLTGEASGALAKSESAVPVTYVVHTQVDPKRSDDDVVAIQQTSCMATTSEFCIDKDGGLVLADNDEAVVNIGLNKFALDRRTGMPVDDQGKYVTDTDLVRSYEGVVVKFPFNVEKKSYDYWDGTLGRAVTAYYKGVKTIRGLKTYRFEVSIPATQAEVSDGIQGTYEAAQTIWVDPKTGAFIDQEGSQKVSLADGTLMLDAKVRYNDATIAENVDKAEDNHRSLWLVDTVLRFVAPVLGVLLILGGILVLRRRKA
jgi:hypothetical protein